MTAGHGGHMGDMRRLAHGGHGRLDVLGLEFGGGMGVEQGAERLGVGHHRFPFPAAAATFFSTTSQIMAAMSGPPKSRTCLMPVGEVTLISVR